jgi:membrane-associated phospholipid phosphatase
MVLARIGHRIREHWLLLLVSVACLVFAFAFAEFGSGVLDGDHKGLDHAVRDYMRAHQSAAGTGIWSALTRLGERQVLIPLALIAGWPLLRRHWPWFFVLLFCALFSGEVASILKNGFEVPRPPLGLSERDSFSFPSGHTIAAASITAVLGYLALRERILPVTYIAAGTLLVLLVAISRVYLDMHWFSDVVGGALIGASFSTGVCALFEWLVIVFTSVRKRRAAALRQVPG